MIRKIHLWMVEVRTAKGGWRRVGVFTDKRVAKRMAAALGVSGRVRPVK